VIRVENKEKVGGGGEYRKGGGERRGRTAYKQLCYKPTYSSYIQLFYTVPLYSI
jgi:hypothetical protein